MSPPEESICPRLPDFILANIEVILRGWDEFALSIWPDTDASPEVVRDDAGPMLHGLVLDMTSPQTAEEQADKSRGNQDSGKKGSERENAAAKHAKRRLSSGFDLSKLIAEYRALRANVLRLWFESSPQLESHHLQDMTRFNEGIDQLLAESTLWFNQQLDHSRKIFLATLGHDLRNPLYAVTMLSEVLAKWRNLDPEPAELAERIASSVRVMGAMIKDLLDFTGSQLGVGMKVDRWTMDLGPLCKEVLDEMTTIHPLHRFDFEALGGLEGEWDSGRLRQLISNLLGNAVQHGGSETPVILSAAGFGDRVEISVNNQGTPIPKEFQATIFEPLARSNDPESGRPAGSIGLGLHIAKQVAVAHGGMITVSSSIEEGTTFTALIPRHPKIPGLGD